jgi:hypothetical protein
VFGECWRVLLHLKEITHLSSYSPRCHLYRHASLLARQGNGESHGREGARGQQLELPRAAIITLHRASNRPRRGRYTFELSLNFLKSHSSRAILHGLYQSSSSSLLAHQRDGERHRRERAARQQLELARAAVVLHRASHRLRRHGVALQVVYLKGKF